MTEPQDAPADNSDDKSGDPPPPKPKANFRALVAGNVNAILDQFGVSLVVSTYQAGRLIVVRPRPDGGVNTHFLAMRKPMGIATSRNRFSVGTKRNVLEYRNAPQATKRLEEEGDHDACYIPWASHTTGDIDIHEMAYDRDGDLWFINTRFSCLCKLNPDYSFDPKWRPPFVTGYVPHDRCHLNGLAMVEGRPKYVTTLGVGDTKQAWRPNKAKGGTIMDIDTNEFIYQGLSMPHSPRLYRDKLWVLESGEGSLCYVDQKTGKLETVVQLPGFTRGLSFAGNVAFIGLSQIRESNSFGGLPITERLKERVCGVWMVDINNGNILGILKFEGAVRELFAVEVLQGTKFPAVVEGHDKVIDSSYTLSDEVLKEIDYDAIAQVEKEMAEEQAKKAQAEKADGPS